MTSAKYISTPIYKGKYILTPRLCLFKLTKIYNPFLNGANPSLKKIAGALNNEFQGGIELNNQDDQRLTSYKEF